MLTTNRSCDVDFYRRQNQAVNYVLRNHALGDSYGSPVYSPNRDTSAPESEGKPPTSRKRVPVACERCRKRKIKCSGDNGDGNGCDNCKNSGQDGCQFLRVHSVPKLMQTSPQTCAASRWHSHHYHPYSRPSHTHPVHQSHQAREYVQQPVSPYDTWQSGIEYSGLPTATSAAMTWNPNNYTAAYQIYDAEQASPYSAQHPSYMLPDPVHGARSEMNHFVHVSRAHHPHTWLDSMNSASIPQHHAQVISPVYPLTPAESIKSHSHLNQPTNVNLSFERTLPTPNLGPVQQTLPSQGRETPPLSAASHRSSHTWTTDSGSNISAASSRTSFCGGTYDLTAVAHPHTAREDQGVTYPYEASEANTLLDDSLTSLPVTPRPGGNQTEVQRMPHTSPSHSREALSLRARVSLDSLKASSPGLYRRSIRSLSRRAHAAHPPKLMTSFSGPSLPPTWLPSPSTASSHHDPTANQTATHSQSGSSDEYNDDPVQVPESLLSPIY